MEARIGPPSPSPNPHKILRRTPPPPPTPLWDPPPPPHRLEELQMLPVREHLKTHEPPPHPPTLPEPLKHLFAKTLFPPFLSWGRSGCRGGARKRLQLQQQKRFFLRCLLLLGPRLELPDEPARSHATASLNRISPKLGRCTQSCKGLARLPSSSSTNVSPVCWPEKIQKPAKTSRS